MNIFSKLFSVKKNTDASKETVKDSEQSALPVLSMLIFMVDWPVYNLIFSAFEETKVPVYFIQKGRGTAVSDTIDLLGIGSSEKAIIFCLEQKEKINSLMGEIRKKIGVNRSGAGIAFTIPLSAVNNPILRAFTKPEEKSEEGRKITERRAQGFPHALIYSVINRGHTDEFMNTAREAGASGGTVLSARYKDHEGAVKFFGISVQEERDIILMLTSKDKRDPILKALSDAHGLYSNSQGLIFSLPVDRAMSLSFSQDFNA